MFTYNGSLYADKADFIPIEQLSRPLEDSDVSLVFLSANDIVYASEVKDDWYSAHHFIHNFTLAGNGWVGDTPGFISDEPASVLGCTQHYQVCSPLSSPEEGCLISGGISDLLQPSAPDQNTVSTIIPWITTAILNIEQVVACLTTSSLTARYSLAVGIQGPLPDDQWQSEVEYWHNISLNSLQSVVDFAIGSNDPTVQRYFREAPDSDGARYLCKNQVREVAH